MIGQEAAETLALQAMAWLLTDEGRAGAFLAATGAGPGDLAGLAGNGVFLGAVLDFLLTDDQMVLDFAAVQGIDPRQPLMARAQLPGFSDVHWT